MRTSGLVLDVYDDVGGEQLKSFFPTHSAVPGFVKEAHALSQDDLARLPDQAFALVLVNGEEKLRKFACIDAGNTALNIVYFVKNASKLTDEARQTAAQNLKIACGWYGLDVPEELEKEARGPVNLALTALTAPALVRGVSQGIGENLGAVRAGEAVRGAEGGLAAMSHGTERLASANLDHLRLVGAFKGAEAGSLMPASKASKAPGPTPSQTIKKVGSIGRLVPGHRGEAAADPGSTPSVKGEAPAKSPQHMSPVVDVTDKGPRAGSIEKKASRFALPSKGKYPIDDYAQVKSASAYFMEFGRHLEPVDRHEFCVNLVKRASELSIKMPDVVQKYGSEKYASAIEVEAALQTRRQVISNESDLALLDKVASVIGELEPHDFAALLSEFDRSAGVHRFYDAAVSDPYYSTFGFEKAAEDNENWSDVVGNFHITKSELETFALNHWMQLKKIFGLDFAEEFKKDPIGIYKSMPVEQKKLIIRMATENSPV